MRIDFVSTVLNKLIYAKEISQDASVLAVCGGASDQMLFEMLGFSNVVISNLDVRMHADQFAPFDWSYQDAHNLEFDDNTFDWVFVSDGIHHCNLPHKAVCEMYRVARSGIIVFESRDSLLMRLATFCGLSPDYELEAVIDHGFAYGGLNNGPIPNFIYRWTENDFQKTLKSFDPTGKITFDFYYGLSLPFGVAGFKKTKLKFITLKLIEPFVKLFTLLFKRQSNLFGMIARKPQLPNDLWPWLSIENGKIIFNRTYAQKNFKVIEKDGAVKVAGSVIGGRIIPQIQSNC